MENILTDLKSLRLPGMAQSLQRLMEAHKTASISFADGIRLLIQGEHDLRQTNRTVRLSKNAHFRYTVTMHDIAIDSARGIDQSLINEVNTCSYIDHGYPILITGPTGTGKSWLASALGYHACLCGYKVRYFNIMKLFEELTLARVEARLTKVFERIAQTDLLILDDFGIKKFNSDQVLDLMEIIEDRHNRKATIIASQLPVKDWYDVLDANSTAADAVLDRLIHVAQRFTLTGDSLRKNH
jgi:DNA replication protein DnaC